MKSGFFNEITALSLRALSALLHERKISAVEATEAYLRAIERNEGAVGAYITVTDSLARENAVAADRILGRAPGEADALCGVPFSIKDNIAVRGARMTCASRILSNFVPVYSATVCEKLWERGAVALGKTNMDEFAMGSACETSAFGPTYNPLDLARSPGGSSGGAAASVAAGEAAFALGTDTGGSARQPAAFCGLVAMKPTYGRVSRYGMTELASSYDQICPITRTVADNALVLSAVCGCDRRDMTSLSEEAADFTAFATTSVDSLVGLRVGLMADFSAFCEPAVSRSASRAAKKLERLGATVEEVALPSPDMALAIYMLTMAAEASSNLARYDGIKYGRAEEDAASSRSVGFGEEVRRRILIGTRVLSSGEAGDYYRRATAARRELVRRMDEIFRVYDVILTPTTGSVAFPVRADGENPTSRYESDRFSVYANLTGCPAVTLPCGGDGALPCGATLMGRRLSEGTLYRAAALLEEELREEVEREAIWNV